MSTLVILFAGGAALVAISVITRGGAGAPNPDASANGGVDAAVTARESVEKNGNPLSDKLSGLPVAKRADALATSVGKSCRGKSAFYDGIGTNGLTAGHAFWSLSCKDGRNFMIELSPDDKANRIIDCSLLRAIHAGECFTKF